MNKLKFGGAYDHISLTEQLIDGDIVVVGWGSNDTHVARVVNGQIIGKEDRKGDVTARTLAEYHRDNYQIKIFRRNQIPLTHANDPFFTDPE